MKFIPDFHESTVAAFNPFVSIPSFIIAWKKADTAKDSFSTALHEEKVPTKKIDTISCADSSYASTTFSPDAAAQMRATVSKICPTPETATMPIRAKAPTV